MIYWITAICICSAILIQYFCSSRIMRMKQTISINKLARRDIRFERELLNEQETMLVHVVLPKAEEAAATEEAEAVVAPAEAEPEVIKKGKTEKDGDEPAPKK